MSPDDRPSAGSLSRLDPSSVVRLSCACGYSVRARRAFISLGIDCPKCGSPMAHESGDSRDAASAPRVWIRCCCGNRCTARSALAEKRLLCLDCGQPMAVASADQISQHEPCDKVVIECGCGSRYRAARRLAETRPPCPECGAVMTVATRAAPARPAPWREPVAEPKHVVHCSCGHHIEVERSRHVQTKRCPVCGDEIVLAAGEEGEIYAMAAPVERPQRDSTADEEKHAASTDHGSTDEFVPDVEDPPIALYAHDAAATRSWLQRACMAAAGAASIAMLVAAACAAWASVRQSATVAELEEEAAVAVDEPAIVGAPMMAVHRVERDGASITLPSRPDIVQQLLSLSGRTVFMTMLRSDSAAGQCTFAYADLAAAPNDLADALQERCERIARHYRGDLLGTIDVSMCDYPCKEFSFEWFRDGQVMQGRGRVCLVEDCLYEIVWSGSAMQAASGQQFFSSFEIEDARP